MRGSIFRRALRRGLRESARGANRIGGFLADVAEKVATPRMITSETVEHVQRLMGYWDGLNNPDEPYYLKLYLEWVDNQLKRHGSDLSKHLLDAACGPARMLIPLAELFARHGGRVTGVDLLEGQIDLARQRVDRCGLGNVTLVHSDLLEFLRTQPAASFEAVTFFDASFLLKDLEAVIVELRRVLRSGGLLMANFLPPYYLILVGVVRRDWELTEIVLNHRRGVLPKLGWHNWYTARDVVSLLEGAGFGEVSLSGVGLCSGIAGDPLGLLSRPSALSPGDLEHLARVERQLAAAHPDVGRFVMAAAVRRPSGEGR